MGTASHYGAIAAIISLAIIGGFSAYQALKPVDPAKARYDRIERECSKPTSDGGRREIAWVEAGPGNTGAYVPCSR